MKKFFSALFVSFYFLTQLHLEGASIHALLVGDTYDEKIGIDCGRDLTNMRKLIHEAAKYTGMKAQITLMQGDEATSSHVLDYFYDLEVQKDDVLVLYFSMHGFRNVDKSNPWPMLYFGNDNTGLDFSYVTYFGKEKTPRLLIALADVCNSPMKGRVKTITAKSKVAPIANKISDNYKNLFLHAKGTIIASGSLPGEVSWSFEDAGGAFTLNLLEQLRHTVKNVSNPTWNQIFKKTSLAVQKETSQNCKEEQNPQFEILVK